MNKCKWGERENGAGVGLWQSTKANVVKTKCGAPVLLGGYLLKPENTFPHWKPIRDRRDVGDHRQEW